jgi:hypothetical protein
MPVSAGAYGSGVDSAVLRRPDALVLPALFADPAPDIRRRGAAVGGRLDRWPPSLRPLAAQTRSGKETCLRAGAVVPELAEHGRLKRRGRHARILGQESTPGEGDSGRVGALNIRCRPTDIFDNIANVLYSLARDDGDWMTEPLEVILEPEVLDWPLTLAPHYVSTPSWFYIGANRSCIAISYAADSNDSGLMSTERPQ